MSQNLPSAWAALVLMNLVSLGSGMTVCHQLRNTESWCKFRIFSSAPNYGRGKKILEIVLPINLASMIWRGGRLWALPMCPEVMYRVPLQPLFWVPLTTAAFVYSLYKWANVAKSFHKFWKVVSQLLDLDSWCLKLVSRPYPVEATVTVTTTTPGQCTIGTGHPPGVCGTLENWPCVKNSHISGVIVCFPIQWYPKRQTEVETTATEQWLERLVMGLL